MPSGPVITALCDHEDRLIEADEPLASLQVQSGGSMQSVIAIPSLLALVRKARVCGTAISRKITAIDDGKVVSAWASATPDGDMLRLELSQWGLADQTADEASPSENLLRQLAEGQFFLDIDQRLIAVHALGDLSPLNDTMAHGTGRFWTDFVTFDDLGDLAGISGQSGQPLHWRLLDGACFTIAGIEKRWTAHILPRQNDGGFEILAVPKAIAILPSQTASERNGPPTWNGLLGRELAPALRQPVNRIIANAETIHMRLAGPLGDEYAAYAADIADAGRHLLTLVEDLADLEAVEAPGFHPAPDHIDLADCARRAAGILSVRARERDISLNTPGEECIVPAIGEFRRVLQVLLNLLTNAIRYTPGGTTVALACGIDGGKAWVSVSDQGQGLDPEQAGRVFEKFERLGRSGDGGSGLGLYISRRLARAMGGELTVTSATGAGACFVLSLPADLPALSAGRH